MRNDFYGKNNPKWNGGKIKIPCSFCGKIIEKWPSRIKDKNYCNRSCAQTGKHPSTEFKKGNTSWLKGTKGLISKNKTSFNIGNIPWNKNKKFIKISGKNHWNWKGGINPLVIKIRRSFEYKEWVKKILERDLYTCQICNKIGGDLQADHIVPFSVLLSELIKILGNNYDNLIKCDLLWDTNNGRTLCKKCHKKTDTYLSKAKKYKFPIA